MKREKIKFDHLEPGDLLYCVIDPKRYLCLLEKKEVKFNNQAFKLFLKLFDFSEQCIVYKEAFVNSMLCYAPPFSNMRKVVLDKE